VENVVIDISKAVSGAATFTASSPAFINFSNLIEERFDLKYFSELQVGYTLEFEGNDTSKMTLGKIGIAASEDDLNGTDDGIICTYDMMPGSEMVSIPLYKEKDPAKDKLTGPVAGINIQPMNKNDNYGWPESLKSVTITSIVFVAKEGATYPAQTPPTTPPTTQPTETPTTTPPAQTTPEPVSGSAVTDIKINLANVTAKSNDGTDPVSLTSEGVKFADGKTMNWINFTEELPELFDLKYFKELKVGYSVAYDGGDGSGLFEYGKIGVASKVVEEEGDSTHNGLNGHGKGIAESYGISAGTGTVTVDLNELTGPVVGINIQVAPKTDVESTFKSITITSIEFIPLDNQTYGAE